MFYIFLDIDGVLCSYDDLKLKDEKGIHLFREYAVEALNMLAAYYGAALVISSTWKTKPGIPGIEAMRALFDKRGIAAAVHSYTPNSGGTSRNRGTEINEWLAQHPETTNYIILDDETADLEGFVDESRILKTNRWRCLDGYDVRQAMFRFDRIFSGLPVTMPPSN